MAERQAYFICMPKVTNRTYGRAIKKRIAELAKQEGFIGTSMQPGSLFLLYETQQQAIDAYLYAEGKGYPMANRDIGTLTFDDEQLKRKDYRGY